MVMLKPGVMGSGVAITPPGMGAVVTCPGPGGQRALVPGILKPGTPPERGLDGFPVKLGDDGSREGNRNAPGPFRGSRIYPCWFFGACYDDSPGLQEVTEHFHCVPGVPLVSFRVVRHLNQGDDDPGRRIQVGVREFGVAVFRVQVQEVTGQEEDIHRVKDHHPDFRFFHRLSIR
jgi:hypothetical protein